MENFAVFFFLHPVSDSYEFMFFLMFFFFFINYANWIIKHLSICCVPKMVHSGTSTHTYPMAKYDFTAFLFRIGNDWMAAARCTVSAERIWNIDKFDGQQRHNNRKWKIQTKCTLFIFANCTNWIYQISKFLQRNLLRILFFFFRVAIFGPAMLCAGTNSWVHLFRFVCALLMMMWCTQWTPYGWANFSLFAQHFWHFFFFFFRRRVLQSPNSYLSVCLAR